MKARYLILLSALFLGGCSETVEESRAKTIQRRARAMRKMQETYVEDRDGEWERIEQYKEARQTYERQIAESKREAADFAWEHRDEIAAAEKEKRETKKEAAQRKSEGE